MLAVECYPKLAVGNCGRGRESVACYRRRSSNAIKIDWRFRGFSSQGLVVTMINLYLYRERDYGINI